MLYTVVTLAVLLAAVYSVLHEIIMRIPGSPTASVEQLTTREHSPKAFNETNSSELQHTAEPNPMPRLCRTSGLRRLSDPRRMDDYVGVANGRYDTITGRDLQYPIVPMANRKRPSARTTALNARVSAWRQETEKHVLPPRVPASLDPDATLVQPVNKPATCPVTPDVRSAPPKAISAPIAPPRLARPSKRIVSPVAKSTPPALPKHRVSPRRANVSVGLGIGLSDACGNPFDGLGLLSEQGLFRQPKIMRRAEFLAKRRHYNRYARRPQQVLAPPPRLIVDSPQLTGQQFSPFFSGNQHVRCCQGSAAEPSRRRERSGSGTGTGRRAGGNSRFERKRREVLGAHRDTVRLESLRPLLLDGTGLTQTSLSYNRLATSRTNVDVRSRRSSSAEALSLD